MYNSQDRKITDPADAFLQPANAVHRQYEALRAYFVERRPSREVAQRFGYSPSSFRVLCHEFRRDPTRPFFLPTRRGRRRPPHAKQRRDRIVALRKQNLSIYDISRVLKESGDPLSPAAVALILREEGFARLPRRADEERPARARPEQAAAADVRVLDLSPRGLSTQFGGLFLFLPLLARIPLDGMLAETDFPGTQRVPAGAALRALLALKLWGNKRPGHVMADVFDEGLALFAGLNCIPKRSFLGEYSSRIEPESYPRFMSAWFDQISRAGLSRGTSFDLDFHTIPHHGEDEMMEKHYVSKRSRRQKGVLAFLAQDAATRVFCYGNARVRKEEHRDEIFQFVDFWKQRTGKNPEELVFDSNLTTYANLDRLNKRGIQFITLRRRSAKMLEAVRQTPLSAWRRIELDGLARKYRTPRVLDSHIELDDYEGPLRQLVVDDLGHEEPTFVLSNQMRRSAATLVGRYAQRMIIENGISEGIDFFHMDALSSVVAMKVDCDLQLTLMASSLYRLLAQRIGHNYERAKARKVFRDFIQASARISIGERAIDVHFSKRSHNPLLLASGLHRQEPRIPWLGNKKLCLHFG